MVAQRTRNVSVGGSSPLVGTIYENESVPISSTDFFIYYDTFVNFADNTILASS